jgi:hypothetical protein
MWTTENEVSGDQTAEQVGIYNAIRGAGNNGIIFFEPSDGNPSAAPILPAPSTYANMTGVGWNFHVYPWEFDASQTSQSYYDNLVKGFVSNFQNYAHSADGVMPVIIGEAGNSTDGNNGPVDDPIVNRKFAATQAVLDVAGQPGGTSGYDMWLYNWHGSGGDADTLVNANETLTDYGQQVSAGMSPANQPPVCMESPSLANQPITSLGPALSMPGVLGND